MREQLDFEHPERHRSTPQEEHTQQGEPPDPENPRRPGREQREVGKAHDLSERDFGERLNSLKQKPLFRKLRRLGVIRGWYRRDDLREEDIDKIFIHKHEQINAIRKEFDISDEDFEKRFFNISKEDFNLNETADQLDIPREDAYILFTLAQEVKWWSLREVRDEDGHREDEVERPEQSRDYERGYSPTEGWTYPEEDEDEEESSNPPKNAKPSLAEPDLTIADITESGEVIPRTEAGPNRKWLFNMRDSRRRLKEVKNLGLIDENYYKEAQDIIKEVHILNRVRTQQYQVLELIFENSGKYLTSGKYEDIKICSQKEIADELGVDESVVSRVKKKQVSTPRGDGDLSPFTKNKGFIVKKLMEEIEADRGVEISDGEMANIINERLTNSGVNPGYSAYPQMICSKRGREAKPKTKESFGSRFNKSRKIKGYINHIPEGQRNSLRKPNANNKSSKIVMNDYIPAKVFAHFIRSSIEEGRFGSSWPTYAEIQKLVKQRLRFDLSESAIRKYMKSGRILSPRQAKREEEEFRMTQAAIELGIDL